jgi:hypothetical protein
MYIRFNHACGLIKAGFFENLGLINNMGEDKTYPINDVNCAIGRVADNLQAWESPQCDRRVKAVILTKLLEAQLWSLLLVKDPTV